MYRVTNYFYENYRTRESLSLGARVNAEGTVSYGIKLGIIKTGMSKNPIVGIGIFI